METDRFHLPAEWADQSGVLIAWPHEGTDWAPRLDAVETTYVALASAIAAFEPVLICVSDAALQARAERLLSVAGARMDRVRFIPAEYDDLVSVHVGLAKLTPARVHFVYELTVEPGDRRGFDGPEPLILLRAETHHGCMDLQDRRATRLPDPVYDLLERVANPDHESARRVRG